ncbi:ankyrin repeat-containing domain protein [Aspergillus alliaceus]|uniref:ankyrin repeat-containing domain protein n=1 Tax=Petromyces alliaceus TaxID=209559 RepID=UPI0012A5F5B5|nr:ankyrin repeat-containing domain protein [Aspergillus alliaceus]KAB8239096.1 ankyrin repeat-containing domain protein [Aspergillus alliaceus]
MALIQMLAPIMATTRACVINMILANESIDVNIANDQGDYPLHVIPFDESYALAILSNLYEKGADRSSLNQAHQTCLYLASKALNLEVVRRLMDEKDSDVRLLDNSDLSPIHHAVRRGHLDGLTTLDADGNSALSLYLSSSRLCIQSDIFFFLVNEGADLFWVGRHQQNIAHLLMRHTEADTLVLEYLSHRGLDLTATDAEGKKFMHHGAIHGVFTNDFVQFLRVNGILYLDVKDTIGYTSLNYAEEQASRGWPEDIYLGYDPWQKSFYYLGMHIVRKSYECSIHTWAKGQVPIPHYFSFQGHRAPTA